MTTIPTGEELSRCTNAELQDLCEKHKIKYNKRCKKSGLRGEMIKQLNAGARNKTINAWLSAHPKCDEIRRFLKSDHPLVEHYKYCLESSHELTEGQVDGLLRSLFGYDIKANPFFRRERYNLTCSAPNGRVLITGQVVNRYAGRYNPLYVSEYVEVRDDRGFLASIRLPARLREPANLVSVGTRLSVRVTCSPQTPDDFVAWGARPLSWIIQTTEAI